MNFSTSLKGLREILAFNNRIELIFHHLFKEDDKLCIYRFSSFQVVMLKSGGDLNGMRACVATDQYTQFFRNMELGKPLRVLDLGAHTGGFIFALLNQGHAILSSLSVEQNQQTYSRLAFNMMLNHLQDTSRAIHAAVWSKTIELVSSEGAGRTSGSVHTASRSRDDRSRSVQGHSVNELVEMIDKTAAIDVCKIDVEGAEWEIFSHLENCNLLFERCRYLIIEIHPTTEYQIDLVSIIEDNGFELRAKCNYGDQTYLFQNSKRFPNI